MKPLKLIVSAFGPFAGETVIDFEAVGKQGVFLISGKNGSGKTSIFDAISFALYGDTSSPERRSKRSIHSDYALPNKKTHVLLRFSHQGSIYEVERYGKLTQKDGKKQLSVCSATLRNDAGEVIAEKQKAVDNALLELLGMNQKQFAQTVMIAQGDFQKIVNASSEERKKLFQDLFHTRIYEQFQNKLKERNDCYAKKSELLEQNIRYALEQIKFDTSYQPEVSAHIGTASVYLKALTEQNTAQNVYLSRMEEQKQHTRDDLNALHQQIAESREHNRRLSDLSQKKQILLNLQSHTQEMQEKRTAAEKAHSAERVIMQENFLNQYKEQLNIKTALRNEISERYAQQSAQLEESRSRLQEANQAAECLDELRQKVLNFDMARPLFRELHEKEAIYRKAAQDLQYLNQQYQQADIWHRQKMQAFLKGQAGILAESLEENVACPVCGSVHHPKPAVRELDTPSEAEVKQAADRRNQTEQRFLEATTFCSKLNTELEMLRKNPILQEMSEEELIESLRNCQIQMNRLITQQKQAEQIFHSHDNNCVALRSQLQALEKEIASLKQKYQNQQQLVGNALQQNGFADLEECHASYMEQQMLRNLEIQVQNYYADFTGIQRIVRELEQDTAGLQMTDLSLMEQTCRQKEAAYSQLESDSNQIRTRLSIHQEIGDRLKKQLEELDEFRMKWSVISDLYKTVSGVQKSEGQAKLRFETYVQQYYFMRVAEQANARLSMLTDGKFVLQCSKKAKNHVSQSGLDLEVLDTNTNQWRDVSTLSGGESFLASLSLALGLSDVVQEGSGGIQLDAMFIDEGFGTLDEEALHQAVKLLDKLADGKRLIGVISHVEALKNRIEYQVCVTKKNDGSEVALAGIS